MPNKSNNDPFRGPDVQLDEMRPLRRVADVFAPTPDSQPSSEPEPPEPELQPLRSVDVGVIPYDDAGGLLDFIESTLIEDEARTQIKQPSEPEPREMRRGARGRISINYPG